MKIPVHPILWLIQQPYDGIIPSLLGECLGIASSDLKITHTQFGKPFIHPSQSRGLQFNTSYTDDLVACVVVDEVVGVDIETVVWFSDMELVAQRCFSSAEFLFWNRQSEDEKVMYFYQIWTLKEAYLKMFGTGFHTDLREIDLLPVLRSLLTKPQVEYQGRTFFQQQYDERHIWTVCVNKKTAHVIHTQTAF